MAWDIVYLPQGQFDKVQEVVAAAREVLSSPVDSSRLSAALAALDKPGEQQTLRRLIQAAREMQNLLMKVSVVAFNEQTAPFWPFGLQDDVKAITRRASGWEQVIREADTIPTVVELARQRREHEERVGVGR